jgi:hypothetical protein
MLMVAHHALTRDSAEDGVRASLTVKLWGWEEVIALIDAKQEAPNKRGSYKKKAA